MIYLLDTNVVSELRKAGDGRADPKVTAWAENLPAQSLFMSAINLMELEIGVLRMERRDNAQGTMLRRWLDRHVVPFFSGRLLAVDEAVAMECARLHVPDKSPERDALIAATALIHNMAIATRNVKDFDGMGAKTYNPWTSNQGAKR